MSIALTHISNKKPVDIVFPTERSIFEFLNLEYKEPRDRKDGRAIVPLPAPAVAQAPKSIEVKKESKKRTLKKKKTFTKKRLLLFQKEGIDLLNRLSEKQIAAMIHMANDYYYNKEDLITDSEYDILKEYMQEKYPNNDVLLAIGAPITTKKKTKLPYFMPSMDKIKSGC